MLYYTSHMQHRLMFCIFEWLEGGFLLTEGVQLRQEHVACDSVAVLYCVAILHADLCIQAHFCYSLL
jgi:hypothetical protein